VLGIAFAIGLLLAACGDPVDPEAAVSITQGVYGLTIMGCDTSDCEDSRADDVDVYVRVPGGAMVEQTKSDGDGFYQLAIDPGTYELCTYSCTMVTLPPDVRLRRDWISGPGGGIWCDDAGCHP
jgi:hypothetical protein